MPNVENSLIWMNVHNTLPTMKSLRVIRVKVCIITHVGIMAAMASVMPEGTSVSDYNADRPHGPFEAMRNLLGLKNIDFVIEELLDYSSVLT